MWSAGFTAALTYLFLGANLFRRRSPYFHGRGAPARGWANRPMELVQTPWATSQKDDLFTTAATHMALLHNAIIRGFNSIYLQAPHVQTDDVDDFVAYSLAWHKFVVSHHDDEEDRLFPDMIGVLGDHAILGGMAAEHESFLPGLKAFETHLTSRNATTGLAAASLVAIMDSFRDDVQNHLHHEVDVMAAMAGHRNAPAAHTPEGKLAADRLKRWGKSTVTRAGYRDVVPFFLLNTDRTFEQGVWARWPRMPEPVRWAMVNVVGMWHGPAWRFSSCDSSGLPRGLYALERLADRDGAEAKSEL
ncbi:uncharacterized protein UV8b_01576 [Ustilaginoidea virens]|uniref:Hemerythrin-like domain-containing protein n=1 Tax=Ustilaginoidea virens TaxID=1159556 RepID=A0A8E5HKX2_USTVR|nr:uncharacterized protein UV8b_01576 [Ustilaginoidea virens]QUC17335.1 hypothetical protein UV8b_01576 [Ustilaginoidea virens]